MSLPSGAAPGQRPARRLTSRLAVRAGCGFAAAFVWIPLTVVLAVRGASAGVVSTSAVPAVLLPSLFVIGIVRVRTRAGLARRSAASVAAARAAQVSGDAPDIGTIAPEAAAGVVGWKHGLGLPLYVRQDRSWPVPLVAGWFLAVLAADALLYLAVIPAVGGGPAQPGALGALGGGVAAGVVLIAVGRRRRKPRGWFALYQGGYAQVVMADPRPRVVRWDAVTEVTFTIRRHRIAHAYGSSARIFIASFSARPFLGPAMPSPVPVMADRLPGVALRAVGPRLLASVRATCDAGGVISFGETRVSSDGVVLPGSPELVPWAQIGSARLHSTRLSSGPEITSGVSVSIAGQPRRPYIDLSGIPNGMFLPALLQQAAGPAPAPAGRTAAPAL